MLQFICCFACPCCLFQILRAFSGICFLLAVIFYNLDKQVQASWRPPTSCLLNQNLPLTHKHTHTRLRILSARSAEAPGLSSPHGGAVTGGGQAYPGPRPLPQSPALAPGAGRQMPCRNPSAECFSGQTA